MDHITMVTNNMQCCHAISRCENCLNPFVKKKIDNDIVSFKKTKYLLSRWKSLVITCSQSILWWCVTHMSNTKVLNSICSIISPYSSFDDLSGRMAQSLPSFTSAGGRMHSTKAESKHNQCTIPPGLWWIYKQSLKSQISMHGFITCYPGVYTDNHP